jgi:hypothetical protein
VFLWGARKECVERLVQAKELTCDNCGSDHLEAYEAILPMYEADVLDVTLKCRKCGAGNPLWLPLEEYRRCGFDPEECMPEVDET